MKNNVGFLMAKANIGPTDLSKKAKVSRNTVQRILREENASGQTMLKIAKFFKKDVGEVFFDDSVLQVERADEQEVI